MRGDRIMRNSTQRDLKLPLILVSLSFSAMAFLLPIYSKAIGMSATEIGGVFSVVSFILLVVKPSMGRLSDKIGRKPLLILSMILYGVSLYLIATAHTVTMIYTVRIIQGIAAALLGITTYGIVLDTAGEKEVAQQLGKLTSAQTIGMFIGAGLSFWLMSTREFIEGWYQSFMIYAIGAFAASLVTGVSIPETRVEERKKKQKIKKKVTLPLDAIKVLVLTFILAISASMLSPILMVYLQDYFTNDFIGIALAFIPSMILSSVFPTRLGKLSDQYGRVRMMMIGLLISSIAMGMIPSVSSLVVLTFLWCFDTIGGLIEGPARMALYSQVVGKENTGEYYGILSSIRSMGAMIGPILGGMLYDYVSPKSPFYLCSIGLLLAAIAVGGLLYKKSENLEA